MDTTLEVGDLIMYTLKSIPTAEPFIGTIERLSATHAQIKPDTEFVCGAWGYNDLVPLDDLNRVWIANGVADSTKHEFIDNVIQAFYAEAKTEAVLAVSKN